MSRAAELLREARAFADDLHDYFLDHAGNQDEDDRCDADARGRSCFRCDSADLHARIDAYLAGERETTDAAVENAIPPGATVTTTSNAHCFTPPATPPSPEPTPSQAAAKADAKLPGNKADALAGGAPSSPAAFTPAIDSEWMWKGVRLRCKGWEAQPPKWMQFEVVAGERAGQQWLFRPDEMRDLEPAAVEKRPCPCAAQDFMPGHPGCERCGGTGVLKGSV